MRGAGRGLAKHSDVGYLLLGQETLDKVPQRSLSPRGEGEGPDRRRWASRLQIQVGRGLWDVEHFSHGCWFRGDPGLSLDASHPSRE